MPVQSLPGPSNIVRGIGEVPPSAKLPDPSKPPLITQYAPQLPVGPGPPPFMHFPPVTPHSGVVPPSVQDVGHLHKQEREQHEQQQVVLWQQHQLAMHFKQLAEQQQLHPLIIPPGSSHHPTYSMPVMTSHGHVPHSVEPVAFTFNPEEVAAMRSGAGRMEHLASLIPPGPQIIQSTPGPFLDSYQLLMGGRLQEEHMGGLIPLIQAGVPASIEQQQQLLAVQHQQQQLLHLASLNNISPQELMETLRQNELVAAQFQKEPALIHDPNVQMILKRREAMLRQMEHLQRMQQEALIQQHQHHELLQKQQQQFILARPPHPDEVHSRNRPGVIVGHK